MENLGGVDVCIFYLLTSVASTEEIFITLVPWDAAGKCLHSTWLCALQSILITMQSERITVLLWYLVWKEDSEQNPVILERDFLILAGTECKAYWHRPLMAIVKHFLCSVFFRILKTNQVSLCILFKRSCCESIVLIFWRYVGCWEFFMHVHHWLLKNTHGMLLLSLTSWHVSESKHVMQAGGCSALSLSWWWAHN